MVADPRLKATIEELTQEHVEIGEGLLEDGSTVEADAPLIKLVNSIIVEAFKMRASDIHLEPLAKTFRMRYRIDGVLHEVKAPPKRLQAAVLSRLKSSPTCPSRSTGFRRTGAFRRRWAAS